MHSRASFAVTAAVLVALLAGVAPAAAATTAPTQAIPFPDAAFDDYLAAGDLDIHVLNAVHVCAINVSVVAPILPGGLLGDVPGEEVCFIVDDEDADGADNQNP
ncbi:hypothetical protein [Streptodolium elevatio]|uniref:Secreted protein n=1 Tax=Streptodolium elevatio TaxID=3157996 RepID=A0ABV3DT89_9ACTN